MFFEEFTGNIEKSILKSNDFITNIMPELTTYDFIIF